MFGTLKAYLQRPSEAINLLLYLAEFLTDLQPALVGVGAAVHQYSLNMFLISESVETKVSPL